MERIKLSELKVVVFGLGGDKAPGMDGFQAFFYQKFWELLKEDLLKVVEESRRERFILKDFNNTLIELIPKKGHMSRYDDFRPISL